MATPDIFFFGSLCQENCIPGVLESTKNDRHTFQDWSNIDSFELQS